MFARTLDHAGQARARAQSNVPGRGAAGEHAIPERFVLERRLARAERGFESPCRASLQVHRCQLEACGRRTGLIGTIDIVVGGRSLGNPGRATTPEATELQAHLAAMRDAGDRWAVIESTSHGLAQDRVAEIAYDVGVLTNITSEHLEFHGTLEAYRAAKRRLFEWLAVGPGNPDKGYGKHAVLNLDDPAAGERGVHVRQISDFVSIQAPFQMGEEAKESIERFAEAMSDVRPDTIGPRGHASDHFITRSSSARSCAVTRYPRS